MSRRGGARPGAGRKPSAAAAKLKRELEEARRQLAELRASGAVSAPPVDQAGQGERVPEGSAPVEAEPAAESAATAPHDPLASPVRGAPAPGPVDGGQPGAVEIVPAGKRLGEAKAAGLFLMLCRLYNQNAQAVALFAVQARLEALDVTKARELWPRVLETARLSDGDREILAPPIVARLAEIEVDESFDLVAAVAMVFGGKYFALQAAADPAVPDEALKAGPDLFGMMAGT